MAFPDTILPLRVDLSLDGTTWTDVTSDVRGEQQVRITRGRSDWGQQVDAGRCSLVLGNTDGRYSPRNPEGAYYGQIGRNTPLRVSVNTGSVALDLPGGAGDYASTPDAAALDITGDIDVRIDATLANWVLPDYPSSGQLDLPRTELIAKRAAGQISWALYIAKSRPHFEWSTDGSTANFVRSSYDLPLTASGRLAIRVALDVNNGAGGYHIAFYTAPTIDGPWTELDSGDVGGGTTSIFSSTASLKIGDATETTTWNPALGIVHAAEVYDGIGGTLVAAPDFTAQTSGTTSFADSAGRTWTLAGNTEITNRKTRFVGEVASWTPRWETGGMDVVTEVEAAGVLRRLGQGAVPVKSPFYREFTSAGRVDTGIVAYWPMEDGAEATSLASAYDGHPAMKITGTVTPGAYSDWVASNAIPTIGTGSLKVSVPSYEVTSGVTRLGFFAKVPAAGVVSTQRLMSLSQTGTAHVWSVYVNTSGNLAVRAYDNEGTQIHDSGFGSDSINGLEKYVVLALAQDGADADYTLQVVDIADSLATAVPDDTYTSFTITDTVTSYTTSRVTQIRFGEDGAMNSTVLGHLAVGNTSTSFNATAGLIVGWNAEEAPSRISRIGGEEGIHCYATGPGDEQCGPQPSGTALDIMRTVGDVDEGILAELRPVLGIRHVTRASMYNQDATLTLDYTGSDGLVTPLDPVDDDQAVTNDVTVQRDGGSSARATLDEGALSTQTPPDGIGLYDTSYTLNLLDDTQPAHHAGWRLHLGTWDETRFPQVSVNLANAPASIENAAAVDVGSRIQIANPPVWLPPDTLDLLVQGYSELMDQFTWTISYNCTPAGPFNVATEGDALYNRADTEGAQLAEALTTTETGVDVLTTSGPVWTTDAGEMPFSVRVGGEVMSVTACTSAAKDDFSTNQTDSWGSADIGGTWTNSGGAAGNFDVAGGVGTHTMTSVNVSRRSSLTAPHADFDIYVDIASSQLATGDTIWGGPMARYADLDNLYMTRVSFTTSQTIQFTIRKRVAGVETQLGSTFTTGLTHVAGTYYQVRFQGSGTSLRAKVWQVGDLEPGPWHVETTDSSLTAAGSVGVRSILGSANTNVNPTVNYDNFELVNPQTFTVTRSSNGVTKTHTAGTDVRLAYPAYAAL